jgi:magnesium chelatase family protein
MLKLIRMIADLAGAEAITQVHFDMRPALVRQYCTLDEPCQLLIKTSMRQLQLTARAYHRVLKLSRTIADLAGSEAITQVHLAEALQYRPKLDLM